jgi:hypothetical protein
LGIWLGAFFGGIVCTSWFVCTLCGDDDCHPACSFLLSMSFVVCLYGLLTGILYTGPWYDLYRHGVGHDVNPDPAVETAPFQPYGVYFFNRQAFIDTRRLGVSVEVSISKRSKTIHYHCVAPIVTAANQSQIVYWALAFDW